MAAINNNFTSIIYLGETFRIYISLNNPSSIEVNNVSLKVHSPPPSLFLPYPFPSLSFPSSSFSLSLPFPMDPMVALKIDRQGKYFSFLRPFYSFLHTFTPIDKFLTFFLHKILFFFHLGGTTNRVTSSPSFLQHFHSR